MYFDFSRNRRWLRELYIVSREADALLH